MYGPRFEAEVWRSHYIATYRHTPLRSVSFILMTANKGRRKLIWPWCKITKLMPFAKRRRGGAAKCVNSVVIMQEYKLIPSRHGNGT